MCSLIPQTIPYGVFVGQLHRGYRICSDVEDFLSFAVELALTLLNNGCSYKRLNNLFKCFVQEHVDKYPKIGKIWVMKIFRKELGSKRMETSWLSSNAIFSSYTYNTFVTYPIKWFQRVKSFLIGNGTYKHIQIWIYFNVWNLSNRLCLYGSWEEVQCITRCRCW